MVQIRCKMSRTGEGGGGGSSHHASKTANPDLSVKAMFTTMNALLPQAMRQALQRPREVTGPRSPLGKGRARSISDQSHLGPQPSLGLANRWARGFDRSAAGRVRGCTGVRFFPFRSCRYRAPRPRPDTHRTSGDSDRPSSPECRCPPPPRCGGSG